MTLGVYWYFDFPSSVYNYNFFEFKKGSGGHGNSPAELTTQVTIESADSFISDLEEIILKHEGSYVFIRKHEKTIEIGIPEYQFFDFEFELGLRIELLLKNYQATKSNLDESKEKEIIRFQNKIENNFKGLSTNILQIVGSPLRYEGAETASIRFDCNIRKDELKSVCDTLCIISDKYGIDVLYYLENEVDDRLNLMFFLTNGRQGIELKQKEYINLSALETSITEMITEMRIEKGHIEGYDNYPKGEPITLKIIDREYVL